MGFYAWTFETHFSISTLCSNTAHDFMSTKACNMAEFVTLYCANWFCLVNVVMYPCICLADACLIFHDSTLYLIAGATAKYLYAHDPSKVTIPSQIISLLNL